MPIGYPLGSVIYHLSQLLYFIIFYLILFLLLCRLNTCLTIPRVCGPSVALRTVQVLYVCVTGVKHLSFDTPRSSPACQRVYVCVRVSVGVHVPLCVYKWWGCLVLSGVCIWSTVCVSVNVYELWVWVIGFVQLSWHESVLHAHTRLPVTFNTAFSVRSKTGPLC